MLKLTTNQHDVPEEELGSVLDELARKGARRMIMQALELEVAEYIDRTRSQRDELGNALVVRNGCGNERKLLMGCGTIDIKASRVNDKRLE